MGARKVRIAGVPVDFRVPDRWPPPTDRWMQDNLFWQPPAGWAPRADLPRAPEGWRYWSPNPGWRRATAPVYRPIRRWPQAAVVLIVPCLMLLVVSLVTPVPLVGAAIGWTLAAVAATCLVIFANLHRGITQRLMREAASVAARERQERMMHEYQRYRRAVG